MKRISNLIIILLTLSSLFLPHTNAQTLIAKEQIEDAFLQKTGGEVYGDILASTSTVHAATFRLESTDGEFVILEELPNAVIRCTRDLVLDPTNNGTASGVIVPTTAIRFTTVLGNKLELYSHSFKIGVSPLDLDITSDRNIKFHSDTVEDLMVIEGDQGDVWVKQDLKAARDIRAGNVFGFTLDNQGDKILLYGTLYKIAISANTVDLYSDQSFAWHSDGVSDAMHLDADTGVLTLSGPLQLPIYTNLPVGSVGQVIYLDHQTDNNHDGVYIYNSTGWQQL